MSIIDGYASYEPVFDNDAVVITSDRDIEDNDGVFTATSLKSALAKIVKFAALLEVEEEKRKEDSEISTKNGD